MSQSITVVSGVPRSGTSLVMQMLAAGGHPLLVDEVRPPDVHNPRGYFEYAPAKALARDASWLADARGRAVKVIHALVPHLPDEFDYALVLVRRDLGEVVASQEAMLAAGAGAPAGPSLERLVEIYASQLDALDAWLAARPRIRVQRLEHGRILDAPERAAALLADFSELELDLGAMAAAVEPSLQRQR